MLVIIGLDIIFFFIKWLMRKKKHSLINFFVFDYVAVLNGYSIYYIITSDSWNDIVNANFWAVVYLTVFVVDLAFFQFILSFMRAVIINYAISRKENILL